MDGTPVQIISLSSVMFVAGLCFAVTGFGSGIILNIGYWSLVSLGLIPNSGLSTVLVYLTVSSIFVSMCQAIHYRKYIKFQPKFAIIYVVFTFIATMIGIEILTRNDNPILTRILGGVLFITFMINFSKDYIYPYFQRRKRTEKQRAKNEKNKKTEKKEREKKKNEKQQKQIKIKRKRTSSDHDLSETDKDDSETDIEIEFDMDTDIDTNLPLNDTTNLHTNDTSDNETDHEGTTPRRRRKNDFVLVQSHSDCKKLADDEENEASIENGEDDEDENGIPSDIVKYELDRWYKYLSLIIAVLSSGFLRGLFGAGGPPMILYFLITNIDKRIVRSLAPVAIGFGSGIPFIVYLLIIKGEFEPSQWITYLSTFIGFLSGLLVGNAIHKYVDQNTFRAVLLFILFCGSINLMLTDLGKISVYSSSILMGIFMILLIFIAVRVVQNKLAHGKDKKGAQPLPQKDDD